jgi:hypothetical protein
MGCRAPGRMRCHGAGSSFRAAPVVTDEWRSVGITMTSTGNEQTDRNGVIFTRTGSQD